jgi:hypothetical protein
MVRLRHSFSSMRTDFFTRGSSQGLPGPATWVWHRSPRAPEQRRRWRCPPERGPSLGVSGPGVPWSPADDDQGPGTRQHCRRQLLAPDVGCVALCRGLPPPVAAVASDLDPLLADVVADLTLLGHRFGVEPHAVPRHGPPLGRRVDDRLVREPAVGARRMSGYGRGVGSRRLELDRSPGIAPNIG